MTWGNVDPVLVAKCLVKLCEAEFAYDKEAEPTNEDYMVAYLLFEKFAKISSSYEFQEDCVYDEGGKSTITNQCEITNLIKALFTLVKAIFYLH